MNTVAETETPNPRQGSRAGLVLAAIGAWMQLGPFIGVAGTVLGMIRAFQEMGSSGVGDPGSLSKPIGEVLISTAVGMVASFVGLVLMLIGFVLYQCRQRWLVWLLICVGAVWLTVVPAGVILARMSGTPNSGAIHEARP